MAGQVFAYIKHANGKAEDSSLELVAAAKKLGAEATAIVVGTNLDALCNEIAASYKSVWKIDNASLAYPNAEVIRKLLVKILPADAMVLIPHDTFGMDLSPGLSIKIDSPFLADVIDFAVEGNTLVAVRQEFAGQAHTHVACDIANGVIINARPGAFAPDESKSAGGQVADKSGEAAGLDVNRKFLELVAAEAGDVDITKSDVLVSVGRGIEEEDNIGIAQELADALGAVVSCSRPIVDAKWLEKSRQVGTSGQTVKPKVYMAMGISGSFQHLGGIKGNPFIVAVNKNPKAPIFQVADVGIEANILEFMPALTEKIKSL
ncbi:MAG: electron transfer flavoprotein subunit alpha/FixB family protein [Proteobacteria bacterium]|nr:electron transfer flavoprotein subunit alpha/FixB family protein [Pseudomonadota bacterium]MBU4468899.1 electron transfer flavoprotein subunit alpha/FixB family protein [Pseudomonadota bacterium]MCG2750892.1 electron transfer flavoprotein subunit alpha/FixB family protein [Desulfobacteraceae bacterium]